MRCLAYSRSIWHSHQICLSQWFSITFSRGTSRADATNLLSGNCRPIRPGSIISINNSDDYPATEGDRDTYCFGWHDTHPCAYVSLVTFRVYEYLLWRTRPLRFALGDYHI